ncbi:50S ribosomal protein L2 [Candidatus Dojkabacteria bacterium]|uniref:50S ribosomal protein L2 n=1 Tax=Candidatus Dojkabacteria bacterium TaxID=2099670 RepID=A0A5C7JC28_9BACT|nr:MAG: 50S ribosomal protein L2 [Candidatus Dojkabacteria bacterium]
MKLKTIRKKNSGRSYGKVVVRHQGGAHKRFIRNVDFKRTKAGVVGRVVSVEYDPNRTADVALVHYADGEKRYIIAPLDLKVGDKISSGKGSDIKSGNALPLASIPVGTVVHNVELTPGRGGQLARGAGVGAIVQAREGNYVHLKLPSGEVRKILGICMATVGTISNIDWKNEVIGTAGRARRMGIRPTVRGVAMNPRSHSHGGGEGRSGIGLKRPKTYAGRPAFGNTRNPKKYSNKYILTKRGKK